jgi:hypothetical protein
VRGDYVHAAAPVGAGRQDETAVGPGQQCWASGREANPLLCAIFDFSFSFTIPEIHINF